MSSGIIKIHWNIPQNVLPFVNDFILTKKKIKTAMYDCILHPPSDLSPLCCQHQCENTVISTQHGFHVLCFMRVCQCETGNFVMSEELTPAVCVAEVALGRGCWPQSPMELQWPLETVLYTYRERQPAPSRHKSGQGDTVLVCDERQASFLNAYPSIQRSKLCTCFEVHSRTYLFFYI